MGETDRNAKEAIFENASSLLEEAKILFDKGKYARASALAILSIEESGKCKLFEIALEKAEKIDSSSQFHARKQAIIANYEKAQGIFDIIKKFCEEHNAEFKHVSEMSEAQRAFLESEAHQEFNALFETYVTEVGSVALEEKWNASKLHRGEYSRLKNASLYVDVDEAGNVLSNPASISRNDAVEVIEQAKSALKIAELK